MYQASRKTEKGVGHVRWQGFRESGYHGIGSCRMTRTQYTPLAFPYRSLRYSSLVFVPWVLSDEENE